MEELLTITIDLGGGYTENIIVVDGDDPFQLAKEFAVRHSLNPRLEELLAGQIKQNIEAVLVEREQQMMLQQQVSPGSQYGNMQYTGVFSGNGEYE